MVSLSESVQMNHEVASDDGNDGLRLVSKIGQGVKSFLQVRSATAATVLACVTV